MFHYEILLAHIYHSVKFFQLVAFFNLEDGQGTSFRVANEDTIFPETNTVGTWEGPRDLTTNNVLFSCDQYFREEMMMADRDTYCIRRIAELHMGCPRPRTQFLFQVPQNAVHEVMIVCEIKAPKIGSVRFRFITSCEHRIIQRPRRHDTIGILDVGMLHVPNQLQGVRSDNVGKDGNRVAVACMLDRKKVNLLGIVGKGVDVDAVVDEIPAQPFDL